MSDIREWARERRYKLTALRDHPKGYIWRITRTVQGGHAQCTMYAEDDDRARFLIENHIASEAAGEYVERFMSAYYRPFFPLKEAS